MPTTGGVGGCAAAFDSESSTQVGGAKCCCRSPLCVHGRRVGLEVTELPLLLGIQQPINTSIYWRLVKAAVFVGHDPIPSQTGWHTKPFWNEIDACA